MRAPSLSLFGFALEKSSEAMVKRGEMRDIVGNRLLRRLDIK